MTSPATLEEPWPVRRLARELGAWIDRLGQVWVEGEVAQISRRPGARFVFLTLRDTQAPMSVSITCGTAVLDAVSPPLVDGSRVVVLGKPSFYTGRGTLSLAVSQIRPLGLGELLARIEAVRVMLGAEGLFDADRKKDLPFLPQRIGLITGRGGAAEHDVLNNTHQRWPAADFVVRNTAVQGAAAVPEIVRALNELQSEPGVDVIVIARGGGSVEDLLPFSDETLLRAVSDCTIPVVSAIGHEQDAPLLDLVADVRASTPTDAARRIVPDFAQEVAGLTRARTSARSALERRLLRERQALAAVRARPVMASPDGFLAARRTAIGETTRRMRERLLSRLTHAQLDLEHTRGKVRLLSPASTLDRGYAIVRAADIGIVRSIDQLHPEAVVDVRLAVGSFAALVTSTATTPTDDVGKTTRTTTTGAPS
jgi:exodeoxyribonuclease VII large subunit